MSFCTTLDLQLSFYRLLCYNSRAHCPLLQCLRTTSAIQAGAHSCFVVSSFKCEGNNSCHDNTQPSYYNIQKQINDLSPAMLNEHFYNLLTKSLDMKPERIARPFARVCVPPCFIEQRTEERHLSMSLERPLCELLTSNTALCGHKHAIYTLCVSCL